MYRFGADRTGIPDYAMGPAGARVVSSLTSDTYSPVSLKLPFRFLQFFFCGTLRGGEGEGVLIKFG